MTKIIEYLQGIYGDKTTVQRGKVHYYLGITLDYREKGVLKVSMIPYVKKIINEFPERIGGTAATPAGDHLFQVRSDET